MTTSIRLGCMLGDGIGPEIVPVAREIVDAAVAAAGGLPVDWVDLPMGLPAIEQFGSPMPKSTVDALEKTDGWLLGPFDNGSYPASWKAKGERVPGATLRKHFDLYANIRPSRTRVGVPCLKQDVDLVIVRENTEGFYPDRNMSVGNGEFKPTEDVAMLVGVFTRKAIRRIAVRAFEMASSRRKHVTAVHKSNVMPVTFGMFLEECRAVGADYPDVTFDDVLFDAAAAYLVRSPERFDVIVTENLFGDTLSDLAGELVGALGLSAALNASDHHAMAQAAHGSAPDIAGRGIANPVGMILSAAMLLEWLGARRSDPALSAAAEAIDRAVDQVLAAGVHTGDLRGTATTRQFADAMLDVLGTSGGAA
jgi:3-isopropylmalate dehydrogenase